MDRLQDRASPEQIAQMAVASGSTSVAFTYNDPVIFLEYAVDAAKACHEAGEDRLGDWDGTLGDFEGAWE